MPRVSYIIASTMRTGSYLLCEGLEATGVAGHPQEIFCPERRDKYEADWSLPADVDFADFLRVAIKHGTTANGVFGTKIHWHHLPPLARLLGETGDAAEVLPKIFPDAKYIHLRRSDRRAQAISWYRAKITNEWWRITGVDDPTLTGQTPTFHAPELRRLELELGRQQRAWNAFFAESSVDSIAMDYESLQADYRGEVERVLGFIGEDPRLARELSAPRLEIQRDALTEEWRQKMDALFPG